MSTAREPMWYCHECHAEMRPLMTPDPHCASCRGTFVEMMDDPADDPRHQDISFLGLNGIPRDTPDRGSGDGARPAGGMGNILDLLATMLGSQSARDRDHTADEAIGGGGGSGNGGMRLGGGGSMRLVVNTPSGTRMVQFGGSNTLGQGGNRESGVPRLSEFLGSPGSPPPGDNAQTRRAPAPLLAQYLLSNLLGGPGRGNQGMLDPFEMMAGGRYGDYVVNEQALQNIMNELMAGAGSGPPTDPPAPEEVIDSLPRVVLEEGHPLANDSCSICHEPFNPALAASPDAFSSPSTSSTTSPATDQKSAEEPSLVGVTLPCEHAFHEDCILPWLRMKSTCPVCRKSVLPNSPDSNPNATGQGPPSSSLAQDRSRGGGRDDSPFIPGAWEGLD